MVSDLRVYAEDKDQEPEQDVACSNDLLSVEQHSKMANDKHVPRAHPPLTYRGNFVILSSIVLV